MRLTAGNLFFFLSMLAILTLTVCAVGDKNESEDHYEVLFGRNTRIFTPPLPESASFAGEKMPLDLYYVREALDRELMAATYMHSSTILMFKRAQRWFPVIEPILKKSGIPDDFKFLAVAESNLANVTSPAKAEGYWQFLEATGKQYGLEITETVDERYNMERATEAACAYLNAAKARFGQWALVAAAYNRGSEGLDKAIKNQGVSNYYDLYLNDETSRYVYRIVALKEVYNNPVKYGFYLREQDFYPPIKTRDLIVDSSISNLPAFAKNLGINYRILRELNPWLQNYSLANKSGKRYTLKIPEEQAIRRPAESGSGKSATFFRDSLKIVDLQ